MVDVHDKETRSRNMSAIRASDTKPEIIVRKALFSRGFRYRLNLRTLPGTPDIVLPKHRTCIFVNGCFWHMHLGCPLFVLPKTRTEFWKKKLSATAERDNEVYGRLIELGWRVIIIWECALKGRSSLQADTLIERLSYLIKMDAFTDKPLLIE